MNHIKLDEVTGFAWCGEALDTTFHFKDVEQALMNNVHGERLICQHCLRCVITTLLKLPPNVELTADAHGSILDDLEILHERT